jgi:flagellar protein FliS
VLNPTLWKAPAGAAQPRATGAAAARYQADKVASATPAELTGMLFSALLSRIDEADALLAQGAPGQANPKLQRAQAIVDELRGCLNPEAGELAVALDGVYAWATQLLVTACVRADRDALAQARQLLEPIATAWKQSVLGGKDPA